jgi:prolyl-tRNA synthetase
MEREFDIDKNKDFNQWFSEVLKAAELIDQRYNIKGFVVHMPFAAITEKIIYRIYEDELERNGHHPAFFPSLIPASCLKVEEEHVEGFAPNVFWITEGGSSKFEERLALRPTSETAIYPMYAQWVRSWRDLPLKVYQSCQVWRHETKATRPLLRDREFYWIEAHDVFATREEAESQVLEDMDIVKAVLGDRLGIPFFFFRRPEWDKFHGAEYTFGSDALMPDGEVIQLPSTHFLGQNFSKAFDIKFIDDGEEEKFAWQTCYGPGISRIYAALISIHGDSKGLVLPFDLAPIQVVIIPIPAKDKEEAILAKCSEIKGKAEKAGLRTVLDDSDSTPGFKFNLWELRGASVRFEVGAKELENGNVTACRRDTGKREFLKDGDVDDYLANVGSKILDNLKGKAEASLKENMREASDLDGIRNALEKGGFVRVMFCSRDIDGEACAETIKEDTGGEVRGNIHGKTEEASGKCVICGKEAKEVLYVAKSY